MSFDTPVVLLIYNRPDCARQVFQQICQVKPKSLFIVADGPQDNKLNDEVLCQQTRSITEHINWECDVQRNYSNQNMGCKNRVSSGLTWVFEQVDRAIVLEDDCIPDPSFFFYCQELLEYYQNDTRIMVISGNNFQRGKKINNYSYYFSIYNHCWGWATWKRAWEFYDKEMKLWPEVKEKQLLYNILRTKKIVQYWEKQFQATYEEKINSWYYRWLLSCWLQRGLTILPSVNLVKNIGFSETSTHTKKLYTPIDRLKTEEMQWPIEHPPYMLQEIYADHLTEKFFFVPSLKWRIIQKLRNLHLLPSISAGT